MNANGQLLETLTRSEMLQNYDRAHAIGATLAVESAPGRGVTVRCTMPLEQNAR